MSRRWSETSVLSGPPLSVGRLRQNSERDPHLRWRGVGLTACVGTFEPGGDARRENSRALPAMPRLLTEMPPEDVGGALGIDPSRRSIASAGRLASSRRMLAGFFESGGREIVILDDARFTRAGSAIGDDGGPGKRTGIFQLLDMQEVSTLVVLGAGEADGRKRVLDVARRRPDKFFLLPAASRSEDAGGGAEEKSVSFLLPNAAEVRPISDDPAEVGPREAKSIQSAAGPFEAGLVDGFRDIGRLVAKLANTDFSDQPSFHRGAISARWSRRSPEMLRLMAWRRWEGLRRSIELGSRWAVMELHHPLVWRHLERDIRGFLFRMAEYGLIRGPGPGGYQVRCSPRASRTLRGSSPLEAAVAAVDIHVAVRLKPPYDAALGPAASFVSDSGSDVDPKTAREELRPPVGRREPAEVEEKDRSSSGGEEQP